jgi:hypothetical protein
MHLKHKWAGGCIDAKISGQVPFPIMVLSLTPKNVCSGVTALSGGILTIVMGAVPADNLHNWKWLIIGLAAITVIASLIQMFLASHEDRELTKKIEVLIATHTTLPQQEVKSLTQQPEEPAPPETKPIIDGEVYRLVMSPRSIAWPLVRDVYRIQGKPDAAVIDTDILVEMYVVNRDPEKTRYVRDVRLSAEVNGLRKEFKRQDDLKADNFNDKEYEYGLKEQSFSEVEPIASLSRTFPLALAPEQPIEGWLRFMAREINADKIVQGTIVIAVVDSLGNEYFINRVAADRERRGEIGLRRFRG